MTRQKIVILRILQQSQEHPTAEQVFTLARRELPTISIATVYRNLSLMADAGEIRRIPILGGPDRYDKNATRHDHLICQKCGRLTDVTVEGLQSILEERTGEKILSYELNLHVICPECAGKK